MPKDHLTHNIFYIANAYADILKIIEKYNLTYGDYDLLQHLLEYGIDGSTQERSKRHKDLALFKDEALNLNDYDYIKYDNIIPDGKYPIFDDNDYFIKNPYMVGYKYEKETYLKSLSLQGKL